MDENNETRFSELREENNLSKKKVAEILDISPSVYGRWETSKITMPTKRMYKLSNFYRVNLDYLLSLIDDRFEMSSNEEIDMDLVSKRAKEVRDDTGETLRSFAKKLNTSNSTWWAYENGKTLILADFLIEICKKYNYSADWLLGRSDIKFRNFSSKDD